MRLDFVCPRHRQLLLNSPDTAREYWLENLQRLQRAGSTPTPHTVNLAGSALEAAGIYLSACTPGLSDPGRYAETALALVRLLAQLRRQRLAFAVVNGAAVFLGRLSCLPALHCGASAARRRVIRDGVAFLGLAA